MRSCAVWTNSSRRPARGKTARILTFYAMEQKVGLSTVGKAVSLTSCPQIPRPNAKNQRICLRVSTVWRQVLEGSQSHLFAD